MTLSVDNPIINSPFEEPSRYWEYKEGLTLFIFPVPRRLFKWSIDNRIVNRKSHRTTHRLKENNESFQYVQFH